MVAENVFFNSSNQLNPHPDPFFKGFPFMNLRVVRRSRIMIYYYQFSSDGLVWLVEVRERVRNHFLV